MLPGMIPNSPAPALIPPYGSPTIDLALYVGAALEIMERDTLKMRRDKPFVFSNMKTGQGPDYIITLIAEFIGFVNWP